MSNDIRPVIYHLDDGKILRGLRIGDGPGKSSQLVLLLIGDGAESVIDKPDWFNSGYVAAYGGLVPECADEGTEPGQWIYAVATMPTPAAPVTEAEIEAAGDARFHALAELSDNEDPYEYGRLLREVTRTRAAFNSLIARHVQQATAAAEELARAADDAVSVVEYHAGRFGEPPTERVRLSRDRFDALRTALAAFRSAQGGAK